MRFLRCWQRPVPNFTPTLRFPRSPLTGSDSHWRNRIKLSTRDISLWKTMGLGSCRGVGRGRKHLDHILTPTDPDPEPRRLSPDRDIMKWQFRDDWGFPNDRAPKDPKAPHPPVFRGSRWRAFLCGSTYNPPGGCQRVATSSPSTPLSEECTRTIRESVAYCVLSKICGSLKMV